MDSFDLLCDLDGVVIDIGTPWLERINRDFECTVRWDDVTDWDLRAFVPERARDAVYGYLHDPTLYDNAPAIPGALSSLASLRAEGVDVTFVSAGTDAQTAGKIAWLRRHGLLPDAETDPLATDFIRSAKKRLVRGDLRVDDYWGNLARCSGPAILFPAPYNAHLSAGPWLRPDAVATAWMTIETWVHGLRSGTQSASVLETDPAAVRAALED